jgi:hypothetical protein
MGMSPGALCLSFPFLSDFEIRLANGATGANPSFGRVDIMFDDIWGTVCDWGWNNANARVLCREKGFVDGLAKRGSHFGAGRGPVWVDRFYCRGKEKSLMGCLNSGFNVTTRGYSYCKYHRRDASVMCYNEMIGKNTSIENNNIVVKEKMYLTVKVFLTFRFTDNCILDRRNYEKEEIVITCI